MNNYEDEIYHSAYSDGYSDGYYAGMELYHADDEMTEEERRARRKRRRRNIALGVAGAAGAGAAGYAIGRALRKRKGPRLIGGPKLKRVKVDPRDVEEPIGWDFKRNRPRYASDEHNEAKYHTYERLKRWREVDGTNGTVRDIDPTEPYKRFFK